MRIVPFVRSVNQKQSECQTKFTVSLKKEPGALNFLSNDSFLICWKSAKHDCYVTSDTAFVYLLQIFSSRFAVPLRVARFTLDLYFCHFAALDVTRGICLRESPEY